MAQIVIDSNSNLIQGDFDSATINNRTKFQTSTPNANTGVYAIPNGTGTSAGYQATNNSDPTNASKIVMATNGSTDTQIISGVNGSGTYLPLSFYTNNALAGQFSTAGNLTVTGSVTAASFPSPTFTGTPTGVGILTSATAQASTSGTFIDFTGIPSWVKRITVMLTGVSTNGTSFLQIQLGDSGGVETSGYAGTTGIQVGAYPGVAAGQNTTAGFQLEFQNSGASILRSGSVVFSLLNATTNMWVAQGMMNHETSTNLFTVTGSKALSATLDRVRVTTVNGTDTFDAGTINILYE